jgi:hypothetical protein
VEGAARYQLHPSRATQLSLPRDRTVYSRRRRGGLASSRSLAAGLPALQVFAKAVEGLDAHEGGVVQSSQDDRAGRNLRLRDVQSTTDCICNRAGVPRRGADPRDDAILHLRQQRVRLGLVEGWISSEVRQAISVSGVQIRWVARPSPGSGASAAVSMPSTNATTNPVSSWVPAASSSRRSASATVSALR